MVLTSYRSRRKLGVRSHEIPQTRHWQHFSANFSPLWLDSGVLLRNYPELRHSDCHAHGDHHGGADALHHQEHEIHDVDAEVAARDQEIATEI